MSDYPECPINEPNQCVFVNGYKCSTLMAWRPEYNRKGELLNSNPNTITTKLSCYTCQKSWVRRRKNGETTFKEVDIPKGDVNPMYFGPPGLLNVKTEHFYIPSDDETDKD